MSESTESIYAALFALVSGAPGLKTSGRRLKSWDDLSPEAMPALFQVQADQIPEQRRGLPTKWRLMAELIVYVSDGLDPAANPSTALNSIRDYLVARLAVTDDPENVQRLGLASVQHAWISGPVKVDEGPQGGISIMLIPVEILTV